VGSAQGVLEEENKKPPVARKERTQFGRTEQLGLKNQQVDHSFDPSGLASAGLRVWENQFEVSKMVTLVPTHLIFQTHRRQKYRTADGRITTAPGPLKLKEGSRYSIEFAVEVGLRKYDLHLPLDRQVKDFRSLGLDVKSQTLFDQIDTVAWYLQGHVMPLLNQEKKESRLHIADDTWWMNLAKKELKESSKFYLWGVISGRATIYQLYDGRNKTVAKHFLGDCQGVLLSDGHSSFNTLENINLLWANDWSHVRRYFIKAESQFTKESQFFLEEIKNLFMLEREFKSKPLDEIKALRQEKSKPIVEKIYAELLAMKNTLPSLSLGKAVHYALNLWRGLTLFLDHPEVLIHSNDIENALRGPVVGRKNHFGSKSLQTGMVASTWYSVITTCYRNNVDPRTYINTTIKRILMKKSIQAPWDFTPEVEI
jgi:transposase